MQLKHNKSWEFPLALLVATFGSLGNPLTEFESIDLKTCAYVEDETYELYESLK